MGRNLDKLLIKCVFILCILISCKSYALLVNGHVTDESCDTSIAGVTITFPQFSISTVSDSKGDFTVNIPFTETSTYTVVCHSPNFVDRVRYDVNLDTTLDVNNVDIFMTPFDITTTIGAGGGVISIGSTQITIPAGALSQNTLLSIAVHTSAGISSIPGGEAIMGGVSILPYTVTFSLPVTITTPLFTNCSSGMTLPVYSCNIDAGTDSQTGTATVSADGSSVTYNIANSSLTRISFPIRLRPINIIKTTKCYTDWSSDVPNGPCGVNSVTISATDNYQLSGNAGISVEFVSANTGIQIGHSETISQTLTSGQCELKKNYLCFLKTYYCLRINWVILGGVIWPGPFYCTIVHNTPQFATGSLIVTNTTNSPCTYFDKALGTVYCTNNTYLDKNNNIIRYPNSNTYERPDIKPSQCNDACQACP
jgi:hypothetical protein